MKYFVFVAVLTLQLSFAAGTLPLMKVTGGMPNLSFISTYHCISSFAEFI